MALRAVWKGFLKFGSVACGIKLINAISESDRIHFRILNRKDRLPVKAAYVDEETGEVVDTEDQVKGYELDKGGYVLLEPDEIKKLKLTSHHTLEAEEFVDAASIDQRYLDKPYYVVPADAVAVEPFAVIREALKKTQAAARSCIVLYQRGREVVIRPHGKGMIMTTLRNANEVISEKIVFDGIKGVEARSGNDRDRQAPDRQEGRQIRSLEVRGPLREGADRDDQCEEGRQEAAQARRSSKRKRRQPCRRAAKEPEKRRHQGRKARKNRAWPPKEISSIGEKSLAGTPDIPILPALLEGAGVGHCRGDGRKFLAFGEYRLFTTERRKGPELKQLLAAVAVSLIASDALAISRHDITNMVCASVQALIETEGEVILTYRRGILGLPIYDRFVKSRQYCGSNEVIRRTGLATTDAKYCQVSKCVESEIFISR